MYGKKFQSSSLTCLTCGYAVMTKKLALRILSSARRYIDDPVAVNCDASEATLNIVTDANGEPKFERSSALRPERY